MISESVSSILARQETANQQDASGGGQNIVDKDGFLKLLIAQMEHQDPFEPMENAEMMSQMAQFSTLEQLQNINGNLTSGLQWDLLFNQTINNTMATSLIGRDIEATGREIVVTPDGTSSMRFDIGSYASDVTIEVLDANGETIYSEQKQGLDAGSHEWVWDGNNAQGARVVPGTYAVRFKANDLEGSPVAVNSFRIGTVESIEYSEGQAFLIVAGQRISLGDVQRISVGS